jgi:S-layer homology domain
MRRESSSLAFLIAGCFLVPIAAVGQMGATMETTAMLASPTLRPEGRKAIQDRIDAVHARFRERHEGLGPEQFGAQCCQITQIPAAAFAPGFGLHWTHVGSGYLTRPTGLSQNVLAPVQLPSGVVIEYLDLYYFDIDPADDIDATLYAYSGGAPDSGSPSKTILTTAQSAGNPGYGYAFSSILGLGYTVNNNVAYDPAAAQLAVVVNSPDSDANLSFKAVDIRWRRQVSPAPATPTFNDVPASDAAFPFIEALAASGITAGCSESPPLYCPNAPLTRRQMAVFLSKALGLYWQY